MKIMKILNNNFVLSKDSQGNEVIVKGKGIGFNKKRFDIIEDDIIEKIFITQNKNNSKKLQQFLLSIPEKYLDFVQEFVDNIKQKHDIKLNDIIYTSLSDHLFGVEKRLREGIYIKNSLLLDIKNLYKLQYQIGVEMIDKFKEKFDIDLPIDEVGFIALHFVNAQNNKNNEDELKVIYIVNEIVDLIKKYYNNILFDEESLYYQRFITHLKYFTKRFLNKELNYNNDTELFEVVKKLYKEAYGCVKLIYIDINDKYKYQLTEEEMTYLIIHIQSITEKSVCKTYN